MIYILLSIIILFLLYVLSTCSKKTSPELRKLRRWAYAHRGLHGDGVPENSLKAFQAAVDNGYGSELDVHLLKDGNLAVIHDYDLKRSTGAEGIVENLTVDQLGEYFLEGTNESIPTLSQVLQLYNGRAPLIVELKISGGNTAQLCRAVCKELDDYEGSYCVESFDPRCVAWFRRNRPDIIRGQLTENFFASPTSQLPWIIKFLMRHQILNFLTYPDFIAYRFRDRKTFSNILCRKLWKTQGVAWTLQSKDEFDVAIKEGWIPIFEYFKP